MTLNLEISEKQAKYLRIYALNHLKGIDPIDLIAISSAIIDKICKDAQIENIQSRLSKLPLDRLEEMLNRKENKYGV